MKNDKTALITGASRGIGRAIAVLLSRNGYKLFLTARDTGKLEETLKICTDNISGPENKPVIIPADITDESSLKLIADTINNYSGKLSVLVNNAGTALSKPFEETTAQEWDKIMSINARAPFLLTKQLLPLLRKTQKASIINIGSVVSVKGYEQQSAYTASKHALAGWTKVLAKEVYKDGIRVHLIAPGGVATDMVKGVRPDIDTSDLIQPEEIAEAVLFLINSPANAVIDMLEIHRAGKMPFA